jgi:hypothetical protein
VDVNAGRVALVVTLFVVAGLAGWFAVARRDDANKIATVVSALGSLAAVGVAVWTVLRSSSGQSAQVTSPTAVPPVEASRTGKATSGRGGVANTGVRAKAAKVKGPVRAARTGDADASGGGTANTGIHLD